MLLGLAVGSHCEGALAGTAAVCKHVETCRGVSVMSTGDASPSSHIGDEAGEQRVAAVLAEYDMQASRCDDLTKTVKRLLSELLESADIDVLSVTARTKKRDSLETKLRGATGKYERLWDVTDIVGVRVITYFADDVDRVAEVVEAEFDIDEANSVDRRAAIEPDRFGYISLHYIAQLPESRTALTEMAQFRGMPLEVQVRSVLQHAWAEIEHDLGYKSETNIPRLLRRRFSRLAGTLELADDEFTRIRRELAEYAATVGQRVAAEPGTVSLDRESARVLLETSVAVEALDKRISNELRLPIVENVELATLAASTSTNLQAAGFQTVADVEGALRDRAEGIVRFARRWLNRDQPDRAKVLERGISLFYLAYVTVLDSRSADRVLTYLRDSSIWEGEDYDEVTKDLLASYSEEFGDT